MYMFLENRKTKGKDRIIEAIITTNATFKPKPKIKNEIINAAMPMATFSP